MPAEATTLAVPVVVSDVAARTSRTIEVAVDSAVADPIPADDRASVSFDVTPAPPATDPDPTPTPQPGGGAPPPSGGSGGPAPATPAAKRLALTVKQSRAQLLTNKLDLSVVAGCGPVACTASASATMKVGGRTWWFRGATANLAANRTVRLRLGSTKALRRAARGALRHSPKRKLSVVVTVRVRSADGIAASQRVRIPVRLLKR